MSGLTSPAASTAALSVAVVPPVGSTPGVPSLAAFIDLMIGQTASPVVKLPTGDGDRQDSATTGNALPDKDNPVDPALAWLFGPMPATLPASNPVERNLPVAEAIVASTIAQPSEVATARTAMPAAEVADPNSIIAPAPVAGIQTTTLSPVSLPPPATPTDQVFSKRTRISSPPAILVAQPTDNAPTIAPTTIATPSIATAPTKPDHPSILVAQPALTDAPTIAPIPAVSRGIASARTVLDVPAIFVVQPDEAPAQMPTPTPMPIPAPANPADATPRPLPAIDLPAQRFERTILSARPLPVTPLAPTASPIPPALPALFALATAPEHRARDDDAVTALPSLAVTPLQAAATTSVAPAGDAHRQTLDMARQDWPQKMIDHIEALRDNADANDISIRLKPAALGRVDVALRSHDDGAVSVRFTAEQPTTRTLLIDAAPQLAAAADARGIRLSGTSVDLSGQSDQRPRPDADRAQPTANRLATPRGDDTQAVDDGRIA